jgi:hypothetical protein
VRTTKSFRRRLAVGAVAIGLSAITPLTATLEAGATTTVPLGSVNVSATATGLRAPLYSHQGEDAEAELPYSSSQLGAGGLGHALTSIFWPGSTGGSLGSTLGVLGIPGIPASLENALNDPEKAEAPTINGDTSVSKSNPGLIMQALALPTHVNASSAIGPSSLSGFGDDAGALVSATTNIVQGANSVTVDAKSAISDIGIGPLSIGSIVSTAHATSNGKTATGTTETEVTGVKIAGIGVTIDQNGIELSNKGILPASLIATLNKTVNSALKAAGIQIYLDTSSKLVHGPQISLLSGDLVISIKKPGYRSALNDTGILLELGDADITANATPGYVPPAITSSPPATSGATPPPGGTSVPGLTMPPLPSGGSSGVAPTVAPRSPELANSALSLPGALSSWWIVGGVLLALLAALGLGLLPSRALAAGADCSLEEDS